MTDFEAWIEALTARHQSDLTFAEISRSLRALSSTYVERRHKLREGAALAGAGRRPADNTDLNLATGPCTKHIQIYATESR